MSSQPQGTSGLARRLNPNAYYIALRWNYNVTPAHFLRTTKVKITNPQNGRSVYAWPVDWGPHARTNRIADLSPGVANFLGLHTGDYVHVYVPTP